MNLFDELLFLLGLEAVVPFRETGFARPILDQDELDGHSGELVALGGRRGELDDVRDRGVLVPGAGDDDADEN